MHPNSKLLFQKYALEHIKPGSKVLEIGPDRFPSSYRQLVSDSTLQWDTLDLYQDERLTYSSKSEYHFPVADNTYDVVLSGQVLEHVAKIWRWMAELSRVCKVGGTVITINPVSWPFHEAPLDCWRVYPDGMRALYEDSSLDVVLSEWESLEPHPWWRSLPGRSWKYQPKVQRLFAAGLGFIGVPVERSYDTVTVGRKQAA